MARLLVDTRTAALGASAETAERSSLFHMNLRHDEGVDVSAEIMFGIGNGAFEALADDAGSALLVMSASVQEQLVKK